MLAHRTLKFSFRRLEASTTEPKFHHMKMDMHASINTTQPMQKRKTAERIASPPPLLSSEMNAPPKTSFYRRYLHHWHLFRGTGAAGYLSWKAVRNNFLGLGLLMPRRRYSKHKAPRFRIDPDSKNKRYWDAFVALCVLYTTCIVPYRVSFRRDASGFLAYVEYVIDVAFSLDVLFHFFTGVHHRNDEVSYETRTIAKAYLKGWFVLDLLSTIPFEIISKWLGYNENAQALLAAKLLRSLKIMRLFKLARVRKLGALFHTLEDAVYTNQSILSMIKIGLLMLSISHLVACLWNFCGTLPSSTNKNWIMTYKFDLPRPDRAALQYLVSMYWAIITLATIGYGDIVPQNNLERLLSIAIMAVGVTLFGYVIATISSLVNNIDASAALCNERMLAVKEYMIARNMPRNLRKRVQDHFEYYYQNRSVYKERPILQRLPTSLRNEMIHHAQAKKVGTIKYFRQCHCNLVSDLVMAMHPFNVSKDEYIYTQHELAVHVFFIFKGSTFIVRASEETAEEIPMENFEVGDHFGELELFAGNDVRVASAIAKSYCELTFISRPAIAKTSNRWPQLLEHFESYAKLKAVQYQAQAVNDVLDLPFLYAIEASKVADPCAGYPETDGDATADCNVQGMTKPVDHVLDTAIEKGPLDSAVPTPQLGAKMTENNMTKKYLHAPAALVQDRGPKLPNVNRNPRKNLADAHRASFGSLEKMAERIRNSFRYKPSMSNHIAERMLLRGNTVLHPQNSCIVVWQIVAGICILYSVVMVPLRVGFDHDAHGTWYYLESGIDCFFLLDIVLNFRTAYYNEERVMVYSVKSIAIRYLKGWFVLDLISTIPFDQIVSFFVPSSAEKVSFLPTKLLRLVRITRLLKLARLIRLTRVFGKIRDHIQLSPSMERLLKLLLLMALFSHWNACSFHAAMLASEKSGASNWCMDVFFPDESIDVDNPCSKRVPMRNRYIAALYWAFTTLTTVGYGDIKPNVYSVIELSAVIFLTVLNAIVFGYILSSVITFIKNLNPCDRETRLLMTEMKDYLRDVSVNAKLANDIKAHYQYRITATCVFPEEKYFEKMPPNLRYDIARFVAAETLFTIPVLTVMEHSLKGFISYMLFLLKPVLFCKSEQVCRARGAGTEMFFLIEGSCHALNPETGHEQYLRKTAIFEQYSLIATPTEAYKMTLTVTARTNKCTLYSLSVRDFQSLEIVAPAASGFFLSHLGAVLMEDDLVALTPVQRARIIQILQKGQAFVSIAHRQELQARMRNLKDVAKAAVRGSRRATEWAADILPRQLRHMSKVLSTDTDISTLPKPTAS